jgi:hypothetical protein
MLSESKLNTIPVLEEEWHDNLREVVDKRGFQGVPKNCLKKGSEAI